MPPGVVTSRSGCMLPSARRGLQQAAGAECEGDEDDDLFYKHLMAIYKNHSEMGDLEKAKLEGLIMGFKIMSDEMSSEYKKKLVGSD